MQTVDPSGGIVESVFRILRFSLQCLIFLSSVAACRWGIRTFLLNRQGHSNGWQVKVSAGILVSLIFLLTLRGSADRVLTLIGNTIGSLRPVSELGYLSAMLEGLYYALIASLMLFLAIRFLGLLYSFAEGRVELWQSRILMSTHAGQSNPRFHASRILRLFFRLFRNILATVLILTYFFYGSTKFPRTKVFSDALRRILEPPLEDAAKTLDSYTPNLGYLFVILLLGWIILKGLGYFFKSIEKGNIVLEKFPVEWAEPTYKLCRSILLLFILMVSFPYLPGAHSPFFRGFSVFIGALVTFGSSGMIGNLLAGILLTYTRAFKVGDVVRIEGVYGKVTDKTLLVTRVLTVGNEHVTIPNNKVLNDSVTNYSVHGFGPGVAVSVAATIGYDIDWRMVHKLLLDGAARTEQILSEPAPQVMESSFGSYSVEYQLRAWTRTSEGIFETYAALRRNVLDAFAEAGVEIITPTIMSHRDASELMVPTERFPSRPASRGIQISLYPADQAGR